MANFNLPFGVYVAGSFALDASRYDVPDIAARDLIISEGRGFEGLQTFVQSDKKLYIYKNSAWSEVGGGSLLGNWSFSLDGGDNLVLSYGGNAKFRFSKDGSLAAIDAMVSNQPL